MMNYISVKNWDKFQHYKDRNPPWIKLHRDLLRDYHFTCLQDASKLHLMLIWLLASQLDNKIPNDPEWIRKQIGIEEQPNLKDLLNNGFIVVDSGVLAECKQSAIVETEAYKEETETETDYKKPLSGKPDHYTQDFLTFWKEYPKKTGKGAAFKSWKKERPNIDEVIISLSWQKTSSQWRSDFIPLPATYLNQRRWEDEPEEKKTSEIRRLRK